MMIGFDKHDHTQQKRSWKKSTYMLLSGILFLIAVLYLINQVIQHSAHEITEHNIEIIVGDETQNISSSDQEITDDSNENASIIEQEIFTPKKNFEQLKSENSEVVAWIECKGLGIDEPILQAMDDEYYLHHDLYGNESKYGCIFMECMNQYDFSSPNTFLYGHNMKDGEMFGKMRLLMDSEYYSKADSFYIYTPTENLEYQIFSCHRADATDTSFVLYYMHDEAYGQYLTNEKEASLYDTGVAVTVDDQIVTLVTCTSDTEEGRFIVSGKRVNESDY